jgi:hypothetical protein
MNSPKTPTQILLLRFNYNGVVSNWMILLWQNGGSSEALILSMMTISLSKLCANGNLKISLQVFWDFSMRGV